MCNHLRQAGNQHSALDGIILFRYERWWPQSGLNRQTCTVAVLKTAAFTNFAMGPLMVVEVTGLAPVGAWMESRPPHLLPPELRGLDVDTSNPLFSSDVACCPPLLETSLLPKVGMHSDHQGALRDG